MEGGVTLEARIH